MKKTLALDLYKKNYSLPRKELIQLFVKELNTTENSARTHINNSAKELNSQLGLAYKSRDTAKPSLKKERAKSIIINNFANMSRADLAQKLMNELQLKSLMSAHTHISRISKDAGLVK